MKEQRKRNIQRTPEMDDAREFTELCSKLSPNEKQQVKSIIIGIQIAKEAMPEMYGTCQNIYNSSGR